MAKQEEIKAVYEGHKLAQEHLTMDFLVSKKLMQTKQEQIREGIAVRCVENCEGMSQDKCDEYQKSYESDACCYCGADQVLSYLHSQGVVIKKHYCGMSHEGTWQEVFTVESLVEEK